MKDMKRFVYAVLALFAVLAVSCTKESKTVTYLEVNRNNISGDWVLSGWNGQPLAEGTYFRMTLVRNDGTFVINQNLDSFVDVPREITGSWSLDIDPEKGALIKILVCFGVIRPCIHNYCLYGDRGTLETDRMDATGFWSHRYIITELTATDMLWTAEDDPAFTQLFSRAE